MTFVHFLSYILPKLSIIETFYVILNIFNLTSIIIYLKIIRMRKILLTLIVVLCTSISFAQNRQISGIVTSSSDGEPVIGASVAVKEIPTLGTATDFDGKFVFASLPSQAKTLVIDRKSTR